MSFVDEVDTIGVANGVGVRLDDSEKSSKCCGRKRSGERHDCVQ
jgi:hypothetical protein